MVRTRRCLALLGTMVVGAAGCRPDVVVARADAAPAGEAAGGDAGSSGGSMLAGAGGSAASGENQARILADSVADFALTQGEHGWYYGYDAGSLDSFTVLTKTSVITAYVPPSNQRWDCWATDTSLWTQIFQLGAHPNGELSSLVSNSVLQRPVRRWLSNFEGDVLIRGELAKIDLGTDAAANGVDGLVYVDGLQLFSGFVAADDGGGFSYELAATVRVGSTVDFVLDPHDSNDRHDLARFTGIIIDAAAAR